MFANETEPLHPLELKIIFYAGFIISLPLIVIGNSLVVVAIAVNQRMRTPTNTLLFSLALADLPVGIIVFPLITVAQKFGPTLGAEMGVALCHVTIFFTQVFLSASCLHLLFISVDRYIAITHALRYYELVTSRRVRTVIAFIWGLSVLAAVLPFMGWRSVSPRTVGGFCQYHLNLDIKYIFFLHVTVCVIPLTVTCAAYCKIFRVAQLQARKIASMDIGISERQRRQRRLEKERKITLTVTIVLGVFILCWGPLNIALLIYAVCTKCVSSLVVEGAEVFALLNSGCNPLIYSVFSKDFRRTFKQLLACRACRSNEVDFENGTSHVPEISMTKPMS